MARVLLTGANGHLGANTTRALIDHGHQVVPFVRPTSDLRGLKGLGLEFAFGDITDKDSIIRAAAGCQVIIHSAAVFRYWAADPDEVIRPAVTGIRNVFTAARAASISRVIYTSSTYALGFGDRLDNLRTSDDWNEKPLNPYAIAKVRGEREAWRLAAETGIPLVVLCSAGIWGPYDYRLTPSMRWIRDLVTGRTPVINTGGSFIDSRDAGEIHARAVDIGQPGRRYILAGDQMHMREMAAIVNRYTGTRHFYLNLPPGIMGGVARILEGLARVTGRPPLTTKAFLDEALGHYLVGDSQETAETFKIRFRKGESMIAESIRWLIFTGAFSRRTTARLVDRFPPDPEW